MCECIFCKIIKNKIPSMKIYEDQDACVILDIANDVDGHMVAIPKKHVKSILDCDEDILFHLFKVIKKVSNHCVNHCGYEGINLLNANDESAGQSVPHFHVHMIPRTSKDGIDAWPKFKGCNCSKEDIYKRLKIN